MKKGYEQFSDFALEIERREKAKRDYVVDESALEMTSPNHMTIGSAGNGGYFGITPTAHGQIASRLGIPKRYYDRASDIPGLVEHNVNTLLRHDPKKRLVRTLDGKMRAFLSDAYKPFDNIHLMKALMPIMRKHAELEVFSYNLTDDRLYLQVRFPGLQAEIIEPNRHVEANTPVQAFVTVTDSETGRGGVDVMSGLLVLRCLNGLIVESVYRKVHIGGRLGADVSDYQIFRQETIEVDVKAQTMKLQDVLANALSESSFRQQVEVVQGAAQREVTEPETLIQNVTKAYGFSEDERKSLMNGFIRETDMSAFGLSNAITSMAQELQAADRQFDLERIGWDVMTMTELRWRDMQTESRGGSDRTSRLGLALAE